ncbi:MAG: 30S ribosomal protein S6--L-glutamate ligase [Planctomycetota bacterium]
MKLCILSRSPKAYSTRRLREAAVERGHDVKVLDHMRFAIEVEPRKPSLSYRGKPLSSYDAVIPRIGASVTFYGTAVVRHFEQMGVFCLNPSAAISVSRDKLRSLQILARHDIGLPPTSFVYQRGDILGAIERVGGAPVIIKLLEGTQGVGVILAETAKIAEAIVEAFSGLRQNVLIQKFVAESKGKDVRAFVVGDKVVAAMRRSAVGTEFRSNVHRGGTTQAIELPDDYKRTAVHAAQVLGLRVAGVDMLEAAGGPEVMEVNSSPGLEGIEGATGLNIAGEVIAEVERQVKFPDVDIRQRLTLKSGYTVAEVPVPPGSELIDKTIADTGLRERDVLVLSIMRQGLTIPNPRGSREILEGDTLVCFGKQITLETLVPTPKPKKKKKVSE